ncbi:MAG: hypothetical protein JSS81_02610 [Acidobacteria bacterium]|nr:hypothetical protein [Acidobacteriota bacterium]
MKKNSISGAWLKGDLVDRERYQTTRLDEDQKPAKTPVKTMSEPVAREEVKKPVEPVAKPIEKPVEKPTIAEEAKLKSAANMRRKAKNFQKKTVEVVWEEPENAPNKWFPLVAIVLILLVVGIFYLAMYLR